MAMVEAGRRDEARTLLVDAMGKAPDESTAGRLALGLSRVETNPIARRRLIGRALAARAVRGSEWDQVGESLRELARNPRASLYSLLDMVSYTVRSGDSLWKLCNRTLPAENDIHLEAGLIRLLNGLTSDSIHPGQELLIPRNTLRIDVDRIEHGLAVWLGDVPIAAYRIGLGKESRTPRGDFRVEVKQENPDWYRNGQRIPFGDPQNVLGTRWMGFENVPGAMGYGIHGTDKPESVGRDESMGCVRMRNAEVEALFELVPRGTIVSIP